MTPEKSCAIIVQAVEVVPGDVLAGGGTITDVLHHDGLGGLVDDAPTSVTAEVDYAILRSWAPDAQVIITRNR